MGNTRMDCPTSMYMMPLFLVLAFAAWASAFPSANGMVPQDVLLRESTLMGSHDANPDVTLPWKAPTMIVRKHTHESKTHRQWLIGIQGQMSDKLKAREQPEACKVCEGALEDALQNADDDQAKEEQSEDRFEEAVAANNELAEAIDALDQERDDLSRQRDYLSQQNTTLSQDIEELKQQLTEKQAALTKMQTQLGENQASLADKQRQVDNQRANKQASEAALAEKQRTLDTMRVAHKDHRDQDARDVTDKCGALTEKVIGENEQTFKNIRMHQDCSPAASSPLSVRSVRGTDANGGFAHSIYYTRVGCGDCDYEFRQVSHAQNLEACADACAEESSCKRFSYGKPGTTAAGITRLGCRISDSSANQGKCRKSVDRYCGGVGEAGVSKECCDSAERCGATNKHGGHMYELVHHSQCTNDDECTSGLVCVGANPLEDGSLLPLGPGNPGVCETPPSCADQRTLRDGSYNPECCGKGMTYCDHCNGSCKNGEGQPDRDHDNPRCCRRCALSPADARPPYCYSPWDSRPGVVQFPTARI